MEVHAAVELREAQLAGPCPRTVVHVSRFASKPEQMAVSVNWAFCRWSPCNKSTTIEGLCSRSSFLETPKSLDHAPSVSAHQHSG